tara:strand:- start:161 stop:1114 length:954 start_codon:yes stop_codon:yes gene_type:complete
LKILLTGTAGFIGYHLSKELLERNYDILGIDNLNDYYDIGLKLDRLKILESYDNFNFIKADISDLDQMTQVFRNFNPEKVVNLAAQPGVRYSLINPFAYLNSNLVGFLNIIELCKDFKINGLIYASSSSIYGGNKKTPFNIKDKADLPLSLYGATKRCNELIAHSYSHIHNLHTTALRFFTVYGPWYRPDMGMYIFTKKIIENEPIPVFNNGKMKRDFTYIDDIIDGTISAIEKNYKYEIFNLGNNKSENLMDMIKLIELEIGKKAKIEFRPLQDGDMISTFANINHTIEKISYKPKTDIKDGIPKLVSWYKEYYNV